MTLNKTDIINDLTTQGEEYYNHLKELLENKDNPNEWPDAMNFIKFLGMMKLYNDNFKGSGSLTSGMRKMTSFMNRKGGTKRKRPKNKRSKKTRRRK